MYYGRAASFGHILLLIFVLPLFSTTFAVFKYVYAIFKPNKSSAKTAQAIKNFLSSTKKPLARTPVILIAGAHFSKTLTIVRSVKAVLPGAKSRIILADTAKYAWNGARFSRHCDAFEVIHADPVTQDKQYVNELVMLAQKHGATGFLPLSVPASAVADALACEKIASASKTGVIFDRPYHLSAQICELLDDKFKFCQLCQDLGITAPRTVLITSDNDARELNQELSLKFGDPNTMILKNLAYDCLHRLDLFPLPTSPKKLDAYLEKIRNDGNAISQAAPWVAQTKLLGPEYCAAFIIRNGELKLITLSKSSASQLRFKHIENTKVNVWLEQFVTRINERSREKFLNEKTHDRNQNFTKNTELALNNCQLCLDFIEMGGKFFPIECNPRCHSQLSAFSCAQIGRYVLGAAIMDIDLPQDLKIEARASGAMTSEVIHFGDEVFKSIFRLKNYQSGTSKFDISVFRNEDADFCLWDPLPFFVKLHLQLPFLLLQNIWHNRPWKKLDFCIGKVVELHGE